MLFNKYSVLDVLPNQEHLIKEKIQNLPVNYVLTASETDLVESLIDEFRLDMPALMENDIHLDYGETKIDVSRDPMRTFYDHSGPFYVSGTRVTFIVPFTGDAALLDVQPQGFTWSSSGSKAEVRGNEIHLEYVGENLNPQSARASFDSELRLIKQNLDNLKAAIDRHNSGLRSSIQEQIKRRKEKLLAHAQIASAIGFPIKKREGAPETYSVPVQKRRPKIERPVVSAAPFKPEPALAMDEYEQILTIISNMVQVIEQSPKAFEGMGEENLRTHFLVQLNGQYEGNATGETFNFLGKTDILIKVDGRNIFIAECKFWEGEKQFLDTIDQLLGYLSWRDTKTAILIFNRNVNFTHVIEKIGEAVPKHPDYKRNVGKIDEARFRYVFHQPDDKNREIILSVLAFNIPTGHR